MKFKSLVLAVVLTMLLASVSEACIFGLFSGVRARRIARGRNVFAAPYQANSNCAPQSSNVSTCSIAELPNSLASPPPSPTRGSTVLTTFSETITSPCQ